MAEPIEPKVRAHLLNNDVEALIALTKDRPDLEGLLPTMTMPCLIYVGERDPLFSQVERAARQSPDGTFFPLPGLGQYEGYEKSELVLPQVRKFLAEVS